MFHLHFNVQALRAVNILIPEYHIYLVFLFSQTFFQKFVLLTRYTFRRILL